MFGEIFLCEFPFTSGRTSKIRPALMLFDLRHDAIICRVTSVLHNGPLDVRLDDWASAGLLKASVARVRSHHYCGEKDLPKTARSSQRF